MTAGNGPRFLMDDVILVRGDVHEIELDCLCLSECKFVRNFGPWKKDQVVVTLVWDFEHGQVRSVDAQGLPIQFCDFRLEAI